MFSINQKKLFEEEVRHYIIYIFLLKLYLKNLDNKFWFGIYSLRSLKIHILEKKIVSKRFIFYIFNACFIN